MIDHCVSSQRSPYFQNADTYLPVWILWTPLRLLGEPHLQEGTNSDDLNLSCPRNIQRTASFPILRIIKATIEAISDVELDFRDDLVLFACQQNMIQLYSIVEAQYNLHWKVSGTRTFPGPLRSMLLSR